MATEISIIMDNRTQTDFQHTTFSGFSKVQVKKELLNNLIKSKIEQSNYWCAELICAGHFTEIWEIILLFYSRYIHVGNPKLAIYLDKRFQSFKEKICSCSCTLNELSLRNNNTIRHLFSEMICILCYSKRKHCFEDIKIKQQEFDLTQMKDIFKAPNISFGQDFFLEQDPKQLFVAINELAFHLSKEDKNSLKACYWIEWMIQFESICKSKKEKLICQARDKMPVEDKYQRDMIWIIWDIFIKKAESIESNKKTLVSEIIIHLLHLFTIKYSSNCSKKRKYILYYAVELLVEKVNLREDLIKEQDKEQLTLILGKIDSIYKQIKGNENCIIDSSENNIVLRNHNLDSTIKKINAMNSFSFMPQII